MPDIGKKSEVLWNIGKLALTFILVFFHSQAICQSDSTAQAGKYPPIDENLLYGTKWRYTATYHAPNLLIVHKANDAYQYYLNLKFDNTSETYLNGSRIKGKWNLNEEKNQLFYPFRNNHWWDIALLTRDKMILEFKLNDVPFQYHYVRAENEEAPFKAPLTELPEVEVEEKVSKEQTLASLTRKQLKKQQKRERKLERKEQRRARKDAKFKMAPVPDHIEIAMIGGGYYGGVDPIIKNFLVIKPTGRLIKEFESLNSGLQKTKKDIDRSDLEKLIEFIESKDFFEFQSYYDCNSKECQLRKTKAPLPVPLRLSIQYGSKKKVVTVTIWGQDGSSQKYVDYPPELDQIIDGIQRLAEM